MVTINLREFYPWYQHDEFVEVPDIIAAELYADRRYHKSYERHAKRNKAHYSLDAEDGIESEVVYGALSPLAIIEIMEQHCRLCHALNSLPEKQGKRIEAHYIFSKSIKEIAMIEGVSINSVNVAIQKGLHNMRKHLGNMNE